MQRSQSLELTGGRERGDSVPEFDFDDSVLVPRMILPELLQHPHIPKGLAGLNPRTLLGDEWWDDTRYAAYAANNYCCCACGVHSSQDPFEQAPEAHEHYDFNHRKRIATYQQTYCLCHSCHCFIHSGRLWGMYRNLIIPKEKVEYIVLSRLKLLEARNLQPFYYDLMIREMLNGSGETKAYHTVIGGRMATRPPRASHRRRWTLRINGKEYVGGY